jgi:hypothetical protein
MKKFEIIIVYSLSLSDRVRSFQKNFKTGPYSSVLNSDRTELFGLKFLGSGLQFFSPVRSFSPILQSLVTMIKTFTGVDASKESVWAFY